METYDFTITSVMDIEKPTILGSAPDAYDVTFKNLNCIEYKGSSREFHNHISTCVGRHEIYVGRRAVYDKIGGSYYSLIMIIPPEIMRSFEEAIDPQMLKCRLHVTNVREKLSGQWVPAVKFEFTVIDTVSVYNKEEKDI